MTHESSTAEPPAKVRLADLARAWFAVGTQSMGGPASTLYLIRLRLVERTGWLTHRDFAETYALALLSPGIHIVALAGLFGHRLAGIRGVAVSVAGMMLPAAAGTVVLSMVIGTLGEHPLMRAALAGVAAVAGGMTAGMGLATARSAVRKGRRGALDLLIIVAAFVVLVLFPGATVAVIFSCALAGIALLGDRTKGTG